MNKYLDIKPEVKEALENRRAVVALESTIISHGMPYPENLEVAKECERIVYEAGAVPATLAILDGRIKIGLNDEELHYLATSKDIYKCSRRDIPYIISRGKNGAATVAATMIMADLAGIRFFATGGVGGVHRNAENTMDISADLTELQTTNVCVVSAGVKSILDINLTLEYLETLGIPVVAFGQDEFPAFYTRESGFKAPLRLDTPKEIAEMMETKWALGLSGGAIVGTPIPEEHQMPRGEIDEAINTALQNAEKKGIKGKEITPYLLDSIKEITSGRSLKANMALVYNNAKLAADIAVEYAKI